MRAVYVDSWRHDYTNFSIWVPIFEPTIVAREKGEEVSFSLPVVLLDSTLLAPPKLETHRSRSRMTIEMGSGRSASHIGMSLDFCSCVAPSQWSESLLRAAAAFTNSLEDR